MSRSPSKRPSGEEHLGDRVPDRFPLRVAAAQPDGVKMTANRQIRLAPHVKRVRLGMRLEPRAHLVEDGLERTLHGGIPDALVALPREIRPCLAPKRTVLLGTDLREIGKSRVRLKLLGERDRRKRQAEEKPSEASHPSTTFFFVNPESSATFTGP